ncbi:MAG TPA: Rieske (2Fe-2S) protein [Candidatus Methylomirabilis sp.]|nr:Rieske (2Fe-2S) protein [Candidatus Methylomirabilis sp.]
MAAADGHGFICRSGELVNGGRAVRFRVRQHGEAALAFVIRFEGVAHAYLNRCSHRSLELDWIEGEIFDAFGQHLRCATHGARYASASGQCVGGPCAGAARVKLAVVERDGAVRLAAMDDVHLAESEAVN